jgi:hypothetical protein
MLFATTKNERVILALLAAVLALWLLAVAIF